MFSGVAHAQWSRVDARTIRLDGVLDRDSWASYQSVAAGGYSEVILRSPGGSALPALKIAQDMQRRRPRIRVESHCLSACANYLLLAAPAPQVACGAIVMWHGSPSGTFDTTLQMMRLEQKNPELIARYTSWAADFTAMESGFLEAAGVNPALLSDSVAIVQREGVAPAASYTFDDVTGDYSETVSSGLWIPTRKVISGYGVDTRHFCRGYDQAIPDALKRLGIATPYTSAGP